jgi:hypothetical protein
MIRMSSNPVDVISILVFFVFFLTAGAVLLLRPQVGVRLAAQSLQQYQRFYKLSDEQLERTPKLLFKAIAGDSITEFARDGARHPTSYPKAMLLVRIAGAVMAGFMLVPALLVILFIWVFGVTFVSVLPEQLLTIVCLPFGLPYVVDDCDSRRLSSVVRQPSKTRMHCPRIMFCQKVVECFLRRSSPARWQVVTPRGRGLLAVLGTCVVLGITSCVMPSDRSVTDAQGAAEELADAYMRAMANRDAAQAHALLSSRAQAVYSIGDVEQLLQGGDYGLYEGYESAEVARVIVTSRLSTNPNVPKTMAQVTGTINYQGGVTGTFEANMELEDGQWRLSKVWIVVPPEKLQGNPEAMQLAGYVT